MKNIKSFRLFEDFKPKNIDLSGLKPVKDGKLTFVYKDGSFDDGDLLSDCCGASPRGNGDSDTADIGICPDCGEHCEYVSLWVAKINGQLNDEDATISYGPDEKDGPSTASLKIGSKYNRDKDLVAFAEKVAANKEAKQLLGYE